MGAIRLAELPFDIIDLIISAIPSHRDLVSLAAVSTTCKDLIIPRHTEYRRLRLEAPHPEVWAHLAQRPDLARNIREVTIREGAPGLGPSEFTGPERYPIALVEAPSQSHPAATVASHICQALRNMDALRNFTWVEAWHPRGSFYNMPNYHHDVFQALKDSKSLVQLKLLDTMDIHDAVNVEDYPLWHIADLQTLILRPLVYWPLAGLKSMLLRSPNLQNLDICLPAALPIFAECRFSQLRRLHLVVSTGSIGEQVIAKFLEHHHTIESLHWYPKYETTLRLSPGSLPILKRLITSPGFACSILSDLTVPNRAIECVSQLSVDERTLSILDSINTSQLRDLRVWRYAGLESINLVAQRFPQLTHLEIPKFGIPTRIDSDNDYTIDDYILTLSKFSSLEYLLDSSIWSLLKLAGEEKIASLAALCPNLQRLGHFNTQRSAYVDIVLSRDNGIISWREEIARSQE
ncbi:hypothetical protein B0H17DRAFT_137957 [Mycena rosella]|uniref:F-box domain-containing protein n=1 Tax=Mycena rosella TaxID=1033263 RepID=A0AAD7GPZ3_MYCRO|nr:hypothetical protein B0H17DRAFT_137957 [Mycena rosella]